MYKYTATSAQSISYETVTGRKKFEQILFIFVVNINLKMLVRLHKFLIKRPS